MNHPPLPGTWAERLSDPRAFRAMLWLFGTMLLVYSIIPVVNTAIGQFKDYELWYDTGQHVLRGESIYPPTKRKFPFMYPPASALFLAPLSLLGKPGVVVVLVLVNAAAWIASIVLSVRLATGEWKRQHLLVYAIPNVVIAVYAWSNFHLGQPSLVLLALILGGFVLLQENRQGAAGALIALAAAIKAFPLMLIVYLIYRRYWIATASLVATLVFLVLILPAPVRGYRQARADLQRWTEGMLLKYDDTGVAQRPGRSNSWKNQSIFGVANRLLRHVDADERFGRHTPVYVNIADLTFTTVNRIIVGTGLLCGLAYVSAMPRRGRRTTETNALELALLVLLMLMFTPLAFGYLFACLLFPFAVVAHRLLVAPNKRLLVFTCGVVILLALTIPLQRPAQAYGNTFFATALLFVALLLELHALKRTQSTQSTAESWSGDQRRSAD